MTFLLAVLVGVLYAGAIYMMMRRSLVKLIVGLGLLAHGINLLVFFSGTFRRGKPPLIPQGAASASLLEVSDPLPQALVLTAIVISFGLMAFAIALLRRTIAATRTDDVDDLTAADQ